MKFWNLDHPDTRGLAWSDDKENARLEAIHGAMEPWRPAHRVPGVPIPVLLTARKAQDFVWTWYRQCLVQDHVLKLFQDQGFTGFQAHPVSARWKRGPRSEASEGIPVFWEIIPIGWGGVAPEESGIHRVELEDGGAFPTYSHFSDPSQLVDESQWDGSDFFIVWPMPLFTFVSDRVARFIRGRHLTGASLQRVEDMTRGPLSDTLGPEPLRYYLPEARAREIGEPLGIY